MLKISLPQDWSVRAVSNQSEVPAHIAGKDIPAEVPGCIHLDLLRANLIEDPYHDRNEESLQWIGRTDWEYTTTFDVDLETVAEDRVQLVCEGLDTVATVWINGTEVGRSENMHVEFRTEVKQLLRVDQSNEIRIRFSSAALYARAMREQMGPLPNTYPDSEPYNFIRKNACNFGWDWGPILITAGIWKEIRLEAWSVVRLKNVRPLVRLATERAAMVEVTGEFEHAFPPENREELEAIEDDHALFHMGVPTLYLVTTLIGPDGQEVETTGSFNALDNTFSTTLCVPNPQLWWPTGYGSQPLYDLQVIVPRMEGGCGHDHGHDHEHEEEDHEDEEAFEDDGPLELTAEEEDELFASLMADAFEDEEEEDDTEYFDRFEATIGLREVELDTTADDAGAAWALKVNGRKIWCKGANWIPDDVFLTRASDSDRLLTRITQALNANMNMLRVWGGGIYESEEFYNLCDEMGILVWQDFLFACAAYPEEEPMRSLVETEVRENVTRLAKHPSLVLWNGCNENIWGYEDWGWKPQCEGRTWGAGYYFEILPSIVAELDPTRPYWPGSPYSGSMEIHPLADNYGNKHIWDVWNQVDYTQFRRYVPRFASEFGHQAPPTFSTLANAIPAGQRDPYSASMLAHQKANNGNDNLHNRLKEHFALPADFDDWLFLTQLNQARSITTAVEWFRSRKLCSGALYWQLNDCWPVTSWAAVDGEGREKPLYWATQQFFAPQLLTIQPDGDRLALWAHNDSDEVWCGTCEVRLMTFDGQAQDKLEVQFLVPPRGLQKLTTLEALEPEDKTREYLVAQTAEQDAFWYFAPDKELHYPEPRFTAKLEDGVLTVTAETFLRDLCVFADRVGAEVDCGLVTLLPGESAQFAIYNGDDAALTLEKLTARPVLQCANHYGAGFSPASG